MLSSFLYLIVDLPWEIIMLHYFKVSICELCVIYSNLLLKLLQFTARSLVEQRAMSGWRKSALKCLRLSHVRSGVGIPPSINCRGGRSDVPRKVKSERIWGWNRTHHKLNYFSRTTFPHWFMEKPSNPHIHLAMRHLRVTLPLYVSPQEKRTRDMISLMSYDSVWKCKCETHLHPSTLLLLSLLPSFALHAVPTRTRGRRKDESEVMRKSNGSWSEHRVANLLCWFRLGNVKY